MPKNQITRPTQSKVREAVFSSIQAWVPGSVFLDLFSGSGVMGLEALSRGAEKAVFVETDRTALKALSANIRELGVEARARVVSGRIPGAIALHELGSVVDVAFADPPYHQGWEARLLGEIDWGAVLAPGGVFCLEWSPERRGSERELPEKSGILVKIREKSYGDTVVTMFRREE